MGERKIQIQWESRDFVILGSLFCISYFFLFMYGWDDELKMSILLLIVGITLIVAGFIRDREENQYGSS